MVGGAGPSRKNKCCYSGRKKTSDRPRLRWMSGMADDVKLLGERNWRNTTRNRDVWWKLPRNTMAIVSLAW